MSIASSPTPVRITIDGRAIDVAPGSYLLAAVRRLGIDVPTLCEHPDLEPVGACRLCMVEVTHADWKGWKGLVTSCLYPAQQGLEVSTRSPAVLAARRGVLALLAARCPNSTVVRELAAKHGADASCLSADPSADDCILCGLCTRVCETYATGAITTASRGTHKSVRTFADAAPDDCVGCGACAAICPTGHLRAERTATDYRIWERAFPTALCSVDEARCLGCGACVEACPFDVARVALRRGGQQAATIAPDHCRGCGACVGACPTGAISQQRYGWDELKPALGAHGADGHGELVVLACGRSRLGAGEALGQHVRLVELPCTARASVPLLLSALADGAAGVLVLGRHERTCRFDGAEAPLRARADALRTLLPMLGLDAELVRYVEPAPGAAGPREAVRGHQAALARGAAGRKAVRLPGELRSHEGLDAALGLAEALQAGSGSPPDPRGWLRSLGLPEATPGRPALLADDLALLAVLGDGLFAPTRLGDALGAALRVLQALGLDGAGVAMAAGAPASSARYVLSPTEAKRLGATAFDELLVAQAAAHVRLTASGRVATDGSPHQTRLCTALGHEPVDVGADPLPDRFAWTAAERAAAETRLVRAEAAGALALLVDDPRALGRYAVLSRHGLWRSSRIRPALGAMLAYLRVANLPLGRRTLETAGRSRPTAQEVTP